MSDKIVVLVAGASGNTGKSICQGLLNNNDKFRIIAISRPSSLSKPNVVDLRSKGVEVRAADINVDSIEELSEVLSGVDVLISAVNAEAILSQKRLFDAAKQAGVKRVVPCDFATPGKRGVRDLHDQKLDIREYIQNLRLHYTFIDVGPVADEVHGDYPFLVTDLRHIGEYVARIVVDERTLDKYVIAWDDEVTQRQARETAGRVTGESAEIQARMKLISKEELEQRVAHGKAQLASTGDIRMFYLITSSQYFISMHVLGENSLQSAKSFGALDARELYPDIRPTTLEEFARDFYAGKAGLDVL